MFKRAYREYSLTLYIAAWCERASCAHCFICTFLDGYLAILSFRRAHCINVTPGAWSPRRKDERRVTGRPARRIGRPGTVLQRRILVVKTSGPPPATPACLRENVTSTGGFTSYPVTFPPSPIVLPSETHESLGPGRRTKRFVISTALNLRRRTTTDPRGCDECCTRTRNCIITPFFPHLPLFSFSPGFPKNQKSLSAIGDIFAREKCS